MSVCACGNRARTPRTDEKVRKYFFLLLDANEKHDNFWRRNPLNRDLGDCPYRPSSLSSSKVSEGDSAIQIGWLGASRETKANILISKLLSWECLPGTSHCMYDPEHGAPGSLQQKVNGNFRDLRSARRGQSNRLPVSRLCNTNDHGAIDNSTPCKKIYSMNTSFGYKK